MVERVRGYYGPPFEVYHGVTQGDSLSTTFFNMVMDAVIRHWVTVVAKTEACTEGLGLSIWDLALYLYADNGLITSTQPDRLQWAFDIISGLFDRVGLRTNMRNMVSIA